MQPMNSHRLRRYGPLAVNVRRVTGLEAVGEVYGVMTLDIDEGLITATRSVVNPDKLRHLRRQRLAR
jgi:hypothetical protein